MKGPSIENIDQWLFESLEGNLTEAQEQQLEDFLLLNPAYLEEKDIWSETIVRPEPVEYPRVSSLLQKGFWQRPIFWISSAAAILGAAIVTLFSGNGSVEVNQGVKGMEPHYLVNQKIEVNAPKSTKEIKASTNNTARENKNEVVRDFTAQLVSNEQQVFESQTSNKRNRVTKNKLASTKSPSESATVAPVTLVENKTLISKEEKAVTNSSSENKKKEEEVQKTPSETTMSSELAQKQETTVEENRDVARLPLKRATTLETTNGQNQDIVKQDSKPKVQRKEVVYDKSLMGHLKNMIRQLERMTDNPVALINSKDQYYHAPKMQTLDANFAAAGDKMGPRVTTVSRLQWLGESNEQSMNQVSFDTYVKALRGGIGVQMDHSYYGPGSVQNGQVALIYSPKIGVSKNWVLQPAVRLKVGDMVVNRKHIDFGEQVELQRGTVRTFNLPNPTYSSNDLWYRDYGLGMLANSKWFYAGIQVDNLAKHFNNIYSVANQGQNNRATTHVIATLGTDYVSRNKNISISPYVIYQKMENLSEIWGGTIFRYKIFTVGGAYSSNGDYAGSVGMKTDRFMLTYNADYTISAMLAEQSLSHQMILRLLINNGRNGQRMLKL